MAETLSVKSASGDIDVQDVGGAATASTVSGDLRIGRAGGTAAVSTVSGDIEVEARRRRRAANAVSGDVSVAMRPRPACGSTSSPSAATSAPSLDVGDAPAGDGEHVELRVRTVSGDVHVYGTRRHERLDAAHRTGGDLRSGSQTRLRGDSRAVVKARRGRGLPRTIVTVLGVIAFVWAFVAARQAVLGCSSRSSSRSSSRRP